MDQWRACFVMGVNSTVKCPNKHCLNHQLSEHFMQPWEMLSSANRNETRWSVEASS